MTRRHDEQGWQATLKAFGARLKRSLKSNWGLKLTSLVMAVAIWGGLISQDGSLTREKIFSDVQVSVINAEALQRNGYIVTSDLSQLAPIKLKVNVPQRVYDNVTPSNYNVRLDLGRITGTGEVTLPIQSTDTVSYGNVTWLSQTEVKVTVDEYITRRRIPVQTIPTEGEVPDDLFAGNAGVDPNNVVISGPRSLVENISRVVPAYDISRLQPFAGTQYQAVPFTLVDMEGNEINSPLISVTSENVLLDSLLVEQTLYPKKSVPVNLTGAVVGQVAPGYQVGAVSASPGSVEVAGNKAAIEKITMVDLASSIDVTGMTETIIRAVKVQRPLEAVHISETSIYVTVEILPVTPVDKDNP